MKLSNNGLNFIKKHEGFKRCVYRDSADLPTIGIGHLLTKSELTSGKIRINSENVRYADGLGDSQVDELFRQDIVSRENAILQLVKVPLTQCQFDCLVSFVFNVGRRAFESSTLLKVLNRVGYDEVPKQLARWNRAGGRVVQGLINRREAEIKLWNSDDKAEQVIKLRCGLHGVVNTICDGHGQVVELIGGWEII